MNVQGETGDTQVKQMIHNHLLTYIIYIETKSLALLHSVAIAIEISIEDENVRKQILNFKNVSTCSFSSVWYPMRRCLINKFSFSSLIKHIYIHDSTFNCLVFFWGNSILRREGLKIVNALRPRITN